MSCLGIDADEQAGLSEQNRDALTRELFARWEAAEPGRHHYCFAGSDADLIAAVERLRHHHNHEQDRDVQDRDDRERG